MPIRNNRRRAARRIVLAAAVCALAVPTAPAVADDITAAASRQVEYCETVIGPEVDADGVNEVLSRTCVSIPAVDLAAVVEEGISAARSTGTDLGAVVARAASIHLFTMFSNANFSGTSEAIFYSGTSAPPCDATGYTITLSTYWRSNVTSFKQGHSSCNRMRIWTRTTPVTYADITPTYSNLGGGGYNDNVGKVNVRHI